MYCSNYSSNQLTVAPNSKQLQEEEQEEEGEEGEIEINPTISSTSSSSLLQYYFPNSPFFYHYDDHDYAILLQHDHFPDLLLPSPELVVLPHHDQSTTSQSTLPGDSAAAAAAAAAAAIAMANSDQNDQEKKVLRKGRAAGAASGRRDRHSKINTARGPRDRRMRLSLDTARQFFDLQDMLGHDKASRTVEWLMVQSKSAINELALDRGGPNRSSSVVCGNIVSSPSECEVVSGIDDEFRKNRSQRLRSSSTSTTTTAKAKPSPKERLQIRALQKGAFRPLAREAREKARARARERTIEKKNHKVVEMSTEAMKNHNLMDHPFDQECSGNYNQNRHHHHHHNTGDSFQVRLDHHQGEVEGTHDSLVINNTNWSPSFIFNYQQNTATSHQASIYRNSMLW